MAANTGKIVQVIGPTVDVAFDPEHLPCILNAIKIEDRRRGINVTVEAALHIGDNMVRCVVDELDRRSGARHGGGRHRRADLGAGRRGRPRTHLQPARRADRRQGPGQDREDLPASIARRPRSRTRRPSIQIFETGIKVVDLLAPYQKGGKVGLFGGAGVGKTVHPPGADPQHRHRARRLLGVRRRGRAHARGQRPLPRDDRVGRHQRRP